MKNSVCGQMACIVDGTQQCGSEVSNLNEIYAYHGPETSQTIGRCLDKDGLTSSYSEI